jgi:hypothetical protein
LCVHRRNNEGEKHELIWVLEDSKLMDWKSKGLRFLSSKVKRQYLEKHVCVASLGENNKINTDGVENIKGKHEKQSWEKF